MKSTTRGTLAAVLTTMAAAAGALAATPAAAVGTVPVPVPLGGAEQALGVELPEVGGAIPVPTAGTPEGPRFTEGRIMPEETLPQLPLDGGLPGLDVRSPLPHLLGDGSDRIGVDAPAADLRTLTPGLAVDAPLTRPAAESPGLPQVKLPEAGVLTPTVRTVPALGLVLGTER
ncbi:hypothetical protein [Streptomyces sp. NPDC029526]|uniref:hypothetical protein n=1 Tax=Streptomyces sp. NPDC029526 TaxID=3155728 RepID=UPI0033CDFD66